MEFNTVKPSPEYLWEKYQKMGSVHRVGALYGVSGQTIWKILGKAGYRLNNSYWEVEEISALRDFYNSTPDLDFDIRVISGRLKRTPAAVFLKASRLGFCKDKKPVSKSARNKNSASQKEYYQTHESSKKGKPGRPWKDGEKAILSSTLKASLEKQPRYSRTKSGRRCDLNNLFVRSSWEANIARYLTWMQSRGEIYKWEYEADTFWFLSIKRGTRSYTPDFKIWDSENSTPHYWEVKGWMDAKSKTRLARMSRLYPDVRVTVIGKAEYTSIKNAVSSIIPNWETGDKSCSEIATEISYCERCNRVMVRGSKNQKKYCSDKCRRSKSPHTDK